MRKALLFLGVLVVVAGCKTKVRQDAVAARPADASVRIDASAEETILKAGVLIIPMKVTNRRDRFIQVFYDRCELEDTNGDRRKRKTTPQSNITIGPGKTEKFKMVFGEPSRPLAGTSFRLWLWIQPTDGSGLIENMPPLVIGAGPFAKPEQPFVKQQQPKDMLPPPTEAPPTVAPPPPGTPTAPCTTCGEPRPKGSASCPHCGLP